VIDLSEEQENPLLKCWSIWNLPQKKSIKVKGSFQNNLQQDFEPNKGLQQIRYARNQ
jgi:hypothetical protein